MTPVTVFEKVEKTSRLFLLCTLVGCLSTGCFVSGHTRKGESREKAGANYVWIGSIRADRLQEQRDIVEILATNGIRVNFWGTKLYSILVPKGKEQRALAILQTNELVLDQRVLLGTPTDLR